MLVATCEKEYHEIRALGFKQPVAIVPIGMEVPTLEEKPQNTQKTQKGPCGQDCQCGNKTTEHTEYTEGCCAQDCQCDGKPQNTQKTQKGPCGQDCQCDGNKTTEGASRQLPVASGEFPSATHSGAYWPDGLTTEYTEYTEKSEATGYLKTRNWELETGNCACGAPRLRRIVFFGRIHKVKAVDHLVKAWGQVQESLPDWELVIAGPDCGAKGELEAVIAEEQIPRVRFVGEINGQAKYDFLTEADIYVLPSHTENFGITVAEALACGTPTIASQGTPWEGLETEKCGKWVPIGVAPLEAALRELTSLTDDERAAMGERGRAWIQRDFSWDGIGAKMKAAYAWLLGQGERPDWVKLD